LTREGLGVILSALIFAIVISIGARVTGKPVLTIFAIIFWIATLFSVYFFRDPERKIPTGENLILSPADGKIIAIKNEFEPLFFKKEVTKICIFLSVFDVHINRIPLSGKVTYFDYLRGKFYPAFKNDASTENEQTIIGITGDQTQILFKQIAGILARRIVCHVREGYQVKQGERMGMIKFGSRVDMFLPANVTIIVKLNDRVKGAETIIGRINEK